MSLSVAAGATRSWGPLSPQGSISISNYLAGMEHPGIVIYISADTPVGGSTWVDGYIKQGWPFGLKVPGCLLSLSPCTIPLEWEDSLTLGWRPGNHEKLNGCGPPFPPLQNKGVGLDHCKNPSHPKILWFHEVADKTNSRRKEGLPDHRA